MSDDSQMETPMETKSTTTTTSSTSTRKDGSKTMIIVIVVILLLCCCVSLIAAFFFFRARTGTALDTISNLNGTPGYINTAPNGSGTVSDGSGNSIGVSLPSGFPTDVPTLSGSTVTYGIKSADGNFSVNLTTTGKTTQQVIDAYKSGLISNGWSIQSEGSIMGYILTADKDTREVSLVVIGTTDTNGNPVQSTTLNVGPKN